MQEYIPSLFKSDAEWFLVLSCSGSITSKSCDAIFSDSNDKECLSLMSK